MHPRQRSPRGFYGSSTDYRHLNRDSSFNRPHPNSKPFSHPPPPPPPPPPSSSRRGGAAIGAGGDIFVEAGRLAAEYLVSQGLLPSNVLSFKWNNHSFKKHGLAGVEIPMDGGGRTSALARLGNAVGADGPPGRRKMGFDDFGPKGSSSSSSIRRRGSFRGNGLDWGRDFRRNGSWNDRGRGFPDHKDNDIDDDSGSRQQDEEQYQLQLQQQQQQVAVGGGGGDDNVSQKSNSNDIAPNSEVGDNLDADADKDRLSSGGELVDLKQSSSGLGKDACDMDVDVEVGKSSNDSENASAGVEDVEKEGICLDDNTEKSGASKNLSAQSSDQEESNASSRAVTDLLSLCKSVKVPTKTRSSRTHKNLKADSHQNNGDENAHDVGGLQGPEVLPEIESVKGSSLGDLLSDKSYDVEHLDSNIVNVEPEPEHADAADNMQELDTAREDEEDQAIPSHSGQDIGYMHDNNQESCSTLPGYGSFNAMAEERGEKRAAEDDDDDLREDSKKLKELFPSLASRTEEFYQHNNPIGIKESPEEDDISHIDNVTMTSDQGSLMSTSQFTEVGDRPLLICSDEKQSFPSSFRTCDLNLIDASEVRENQADRPVLIYPPVSETNKVVPVDIDLTGSRTGVSSKFSTLGTSGKEIEVIDLESDSTQEEKPIDNMERKPEAMFSGLEGFSNHAPNTADIHDVQDGYGIMLSELLGADFPNCSSVSSDINSVHNEMGLHSGTGTLAEDDSIYMSLGEIPLSFLRPWEQPPSQDYQKPF